MLQKKKLIISETEGRNFSYKSGDFNKIHFDRKYGYNSIFGRTICHGALVILKFLKISKLNIKKNPLEINFLKPFFYNKVIKILKIEKKNFFNYTLTQDGQKKCLIDITKPNNNSDLEFYKNIKYNRFRIFNNNNNNNSQIKTALSYVSKYVGMIYPGKNSIIKKILIINNNNNNNRKIYISSKSIKNKISIIFNNLKYKNFEIYFETLVRPTIKYNFKSTPKSILKEINKLKENILVIGASQGIGKDLFKLFLHNKKIIKIGTYSTGYIKNKKNGKILVKKITLPNDINLIEQIVKKYQPINIFYFASPKIYFEIDIDQKTKENFNKIFLYSPSEIFKKCVEYNFAFFYPSTEFIRLCKKSPYSKIKLKAEKKLRILGEKYKKTVKIIRFPAINSRQSVSILNSKQQNLIDYLKKNKYAKKVILNLRSITN